MARAKKNQNVVVENENVNVESEVVKMENVVVENENVVVENVAAPVDAEAVAAPAVSCPADVEAVPVEDVPADVDDTDDDGEDEDENAENTGAEKKQRKERAKIDVTPFAVGEIVRDRLACLLPAVVESMQGTENAETLAKAKLYGIGHDIIIDLVNKLEEKFVAYAKNSYDGKHPSYHWLLWKNTRALSREIKADYERDLAKLYAVTDSAVYSLLDNDDFYIASSAKYSVDNFIDTYYMQYSSNMSAQIAALDAAGVDTVYVPEILCDIALIRAFAKKGYFAQDENIDIPARKFAGIEKDFAAINNVVVFSR